MKQTNPEAHFLELIERNYGILLKVSRAFTKTQQDREDMVNEIILELWRALP